MDSNTAWTIAFTIAVATLPGMAFLSWNRPELFDRLAKPIAWAGGVASLIVFTDYALVSIIAMRIGKLDAKPAAQVSAALSSVLPSEPLGYLFSLIVVAVFILLWVSQHRRQ